LIDLLFTVANVAAVISWGLLIFVPRWRGVSQVVAAAVVPVLLAVAYSALIGVWWSRCRGGFGSLDDLHALFQNRGALLAGWLHFLAFDLLVGARIARQTQREGVPHLVVVPILILTFLFGPIGYLAALIVRAARRIWQTKPGPVSEKWYVARAFSSLAVREPRLMAFAFISIVLMIPLAVAAAIDDRTLGEVSVWIKPLKFLMSVGLFLGTLGFFMPMTSEAFRRSACGRFVVWGSVTTAIFELAYIMWRASRGEASHFNLSTPLAGIFFALMGIAALILSTTGLVLAWGITRSDAPLANRTYREAVALGLILTFALGTMTGIVISIGGGHLVGTAPEGSLNLPLVGWSRTVGDLRVPHFIGLHAQQTIAIVGFLVSGIQRGRMMVRGFACIYSIVVIALFLQAIAGHPMFPG
jgi:hypothetical protein